MLESYKTPSVDVTWVFIGPSTWTAVETNIGIVSGNSSFNLSSSQFTNQVKRVFPHSYSSSNSSIAVPAARGLAIATRIGYLAGSGYRPDYDSHMAGIDVTTSVDIETYPRHQENRF
jgi:hypothetical protein